MSELSFNIWGAVAGVLGTYTVLPFLWSLIKSQMPSGKLAALDALLNETQKLLDSSVQEGLIVEERFRLLMWTYVLSRFRAHDLGLTHDCTSVQGTALTKCGLIYTMRIR